MVNDSSNIFRLPILSPCGLQVRVCDKKKNQCYAPKQGSVKFRLLLARNGSREFAKV
jgi:hypothetical protein